MMKAVLSLAAVASASAFSVHVIPIPTKVRSVRSTASFKQIVNLGRRSPTPWVQPPRWLGLVRIGPGNRRRRNKNLQTRRAKMKTQRSHFQWNTMADVENRHKRTIQARKAYRALRRRARKQVNHSKVVAQRPTAKAKKTFNYRGKFSV